jgi:hypothetical protein
VLAARFHTAHQPLSLDDVPMPDPGPDESACARAAGVCGTELHFTDGLYAPARVPMTLVVAPQRRQCDRHGERDKHRTRSVGAVPEVGEGRCSSWWRTLRGEDRSSRGRLDPPRTYAADVTRRRLAGFVYVAAPGVLIFLSAFTNSNFAYVAALVIALPLSLVANVVSFIAAALVSSSVDSNGAPIAAGLMSGAALVQLLAVRAALDRHRRSGTREG